MKGATGERWQQSMVGGRRGVPGLPAQLRRLRRRRHRRPAGVYAAALTYLADLGVDAIWLTPFYPSPLNDGGYDVSDYLDVDPRLGTLADFDALVARRADRDIRVIVDLVPNHCSSEHPLFKKALAAGPGSPERDLFIFRDGRGADGDEPPNNWPSRFGGRPGPGCPTASGTCTCSTPASRTGTGVTRASGRCSRRSCGSGWTGASRGSGWTSRTACSRTRTWRTSPMRR